MESKRSKEREESGLGLGGIFEVAGREGRVKSLAGIAIKQREPFLSE